MQRLPESSTIFKESGMKLKCSFELEIGMGAITIAIALIQYLGSL